MLDNRKHAIHGLWRRNGSFVARITVQDDAGRKAVKWVPLDAETAAEAQEEFRTLLVERSEDRLRHLGRCPRFSDYVEQTYEKRLSISGKKPDTLVTEHVHLEQLRESIFTRHIQPGVRRELVFHEHGFWRREAALYALGGSNFQPLIEFAFAHPPLPSATRVSPQLDN